MQDIISEVLVIKKDGRTFFADKNYSRDKYYVNGLEINCRFQKIALEVPAKCNVINEFSNFNEDGFYIEQNNISSAATKEQYYMYIHLENEVISVYKLAIVGATLYVNGKIVPKRKIIQTSYFSETMEHLGTIRGFCDVYKHSDLAVKNYVSFFKLTTKEVKKDKKRSLITKGYKTGQLLFLSRAH